MDGGEGQLSVDGIVRAPPLQEGVAFRCRFARF